MAEKEYPSYYMPIFKGSQLSFDGLTIVLWTRAHEPLGMIKNIDRDSFNLKCSLAEGNSLTFDVYKTMNGEEEPLWDKIIDHKLIFVPELRDCLEITINGDDSEAMVKSISAVSAGIAELSQTNIYNFEANTEDDIARDDYVITKFYDKEDPKGSLMNRILEKTPQYTMAYIDDSLKNLQRTISASGKDLWSVLSEDIGEAFNCMFLVDSIEKQIYAYDLEIVCNECLHSGDEDRVNKSRFEYASLDTIGECPTCGGTDLEYFGQESTFYIDKENLSDEIQVNVDAGAIKNTLKLSAGDDLMTATVRALNPNGSDYINQFNVETFEDMPTELVDKIKEYQKLYDELKPEYQQTMKNLFNAYDWQLYYTSSMMPGAEDPNGDKHGVSPDRGVTDAGSEVKKLNEEFKRSDFQGVALPKVTIYTSQASVESTVLNYARAVVKAGYVKVEAYGDTKWVNFGDGTGTWTGKMKVTTYSSSSTKKEDLVQGVDYEYTDEFTISINSNYKTYMDQYLFKSITRQMNTTDADDGGIYSVFTIKDNYDEQGRFTSVSDTFTLALTYYSLNRLKSFKDAYENCLAILSGEADNTNARVYKDTYTDLFNDGQDGFQVNIYDPYQKRLEFINAELDKRATTVAEWNAKIEQYTQDKNAIQKKLDFQAFLGQDLYNIYCAYRREDEYNNPNYISEGLNNAELFKKAQQFLEAAYKQMDIVATPQYQISCNVYDLLKHPDYKDMAEYFVLGNWFHVRANDKLFRVRLTSYALNFNDLSKVQVEFSNVVVTNNIVSDVKDILASAKSMATTYQYNVQKAALGDDAYKTGLDFYKSGLISALDRLKTNTDETISWGKFGILARQYDDTTNDYGNEQLQVTHNVIAFTKDGWKTASAAIGKMMYTSYQDEDQIYNTYLEDYGVNSRFVQAGQINGSQMIGGAIYSRESIELLDDDGKPIPVTVKDVNEEEHTLNKRIPITIIDLDNGSFSFGNDNKGNAKLSYNNKTGLLELHGQIYSDNGEIGGWTINKNGISKGVSVTGADGDTISYKLVLGNTGRVTSSGALDDGLHFGTPDGSGVYDADISYAGVAVFRKLTMKKGRIEGAVYDSTDDTATTTGNNRMKLDAANLEFYHGKHEPDSVNGGYTGDTLVGALKSDSTGIRLVGQSGYRSALSSYNGNTLVDNFYSKDGVGYFTGTVQGNISGSAGYATNAGSANYASSAGSADKAGYATEAGTASNADYATNAGYADTANLASTATNANSASRADYASYTDSVHYWDGGRPTLGGTTIPVWGDIQNINQALGNCKARIEALERKVNSK